MIRTSFLFYRIYIIIMYFFQRVTLFFIYCLIKFIEEVDDRRNSLSRVNEKDKKKFSCSLSICVLYTNSLMFYSSPPKVFFKSDWFYISICKQIYHFLRKWDVSRQNWGEMGGRWVERTSRSFCYLDFRNY